MLANTLSVDILKQTSGLRWNMPLALGGLAMGLVTAGMLDVPQPQRDPWDGAALEPLDFGVPSAEAPLLPDQYLAPPLATLPHDVQLPAGMLAMQGYAPFAA